MNTELTCAACRERLAEYAADALSATQSRAIERHLAHCEECRQELAQWRTMVELTRQAEALAPTGAPATLWNALYAQISAASPLASGELLMEFDNHPSDADFVASPLPSAPLDRRPRRGIPFIAAAAAILLVALSIVIFALHPQTPTADGGKPTTTVTPTAVGTNVTPAPGVHTPIVNIATVRLCSIIAPPLCTPSDVTAQFLTDDAYGVLINLKEPLQNGATIQVQWFLNGQDIAGNQQLGKAAPVLLGNSPHATTLFGGVTFAVPGNGKVEVYYQGTLAFTAIFRVTGNPQPTPTPVTTQCVKPGCFGPTPTPTR